MGTLVIPFAKCDNVSDFVKKTVSQAPHPWKIVTSKAVSSDFRPRIHKDGLCEKYLKFYHARFGKRNLPRVTGQAERAWFPSKARESEAESERNFLAGEIDSVFSYKIRNA